MSAGSSSTTTRSRSEPTRTNLTPIDKRYENAAAALFATGPSLSSEAVKQVSRIPGLVKIGCNDAYRIVPDLDVLYAPDHKWISVHQEPVKRCKALKLTCADKSDPKFEGWSSIGWRDPDKPRLSTDPNVVHTGSHSGFAMINIAYLMGCRFLILLGYDGHSGGHHFFGPHPDELFVQTNYPRYNPKYDGIAAQMDELGLKILNANPESALHSFPKVELGVAVENCLSYRNRAESAA